VGKEQKYQKPRRTNQKKSPTKVEPRSRRILNLLGKYDQDEERREGIEHKRTLGDKKDEEGG
jgi:hypothetical protein